MGLEQPNEKKNKNTASIFEKLITMVEQPCDFVAITVTWFNDLRRNAFFLLITDVCLPASGDKINIFSHTPEISEDTENVCYICRVKKANWGLLKVHLKDGAAAHRQVLTDMRVWENPRGTFLTSAPGKVRVEPHSSRGRLEHCDYPASRMSNWLYGVHATCFTSVLTLSWWRLRGRADSGHVGGDFGKRDPSDPRPQDRQHSCQLICESTHKTRFFSGKRHTRSD